MAPTRRIAHTFNQACDRDECLWFSHRRIRVALSYILSIYTHVYATAGRIYVLTIMR